MLMILRNADVDDSDADTDDELLSEWSDKQNRMWADESFFLRYCKSFRTDSNLIQNFLFLKYCNFFPNRIEFGSEFFSGLKYVFLFPNRIQFGSENFIEVFKICFPNRIGIGSETDTV